MKHLALMNDTVSEGICDMSALQECIIRRLKAQNAAVRTEEKKMTEIIELKSARETANLRDIMRKKQNDRCAVTGLPLRRPVLDHQHRKRLGGSGLCRGVIESGINVWLGKIENNAWRAGLDLDDIPAALRQIADYLECEHTAYLHHTERVRKAVKKSCYSRVAKKGVKLPGYNRRNMDRIAEAIEAAGYECEYYKRNG